jgi:hypothetical protein
LSCFYLSEGIFRKFKAGFLKLGAQNFALRQIWDLFWGEPDGFGQNRHLKQSVSGKTKATPVSQVAFVQKFCSVRFLGGYRNDSSLDTKANCQLPIASCSAAASTYICTQPGTPGTRYSIFIFPSLPPPAIQYV